MAGHVKVFAPLEDTIVLVGLMGAGKTSVGKKVAAMLGMTFIDLDVYIEEKTGVTISEIFEIKGEEYFRSLEEKYLAQILAGEKVVLATGGGTFTRPKNREMVEKLAISVWLEAGIKTTLERVSASDKRPLLRGGDKEAILRKLVKERYPAYEKADVKVSTDKGNLTRIAEQVVAEVKKFEHARNG